MAPIPAPRAKGLGLRGAASRGELQDRGGYEAGRPATGVGPTKFANDWPAAQLCPSSGSQNAKEISRGAWATALPSGVWEQSPARSRPTPPVGKRSVPRAPSGVLTYGRRPTDAVTRTEDARPPKAHGAKTRRTARAQRVRTTLRPPESVARLIRVLFLPGSKLPSPQTTLAAAPSPGLTGGTPLGHNARAPDAPIARYRRGTAGGRSHHGPSGLILRLRTGAASPDQATLLRWDWPLCL